MEAAPCGVLQRCSTVSADSVAPTSSRAWNKAWATGCRSGATPAIAPRSQYSGSAIAGDYRRGAPPALRIDRFRVFVVELFADAIFGAPALLLGAPFRVHFFAEAANLIERAPGVSIGGRRQLRRRRDVAELARRRPVVRDRPSLRDE